MNIVYAATALFFIQPIAYVCYGTWRITRDYFQQRAINQTAFETIIGL